MPAHDLPAYDLSQLDPASLPARSTPTPESPERALMRAVLEQALIDVGLGSLVGRTGGALRGGRWVATEARRWFDSLDRSHLYSFLSICDALGIDPQRVRRRLHAVTPLRSRGAVTCSSSDRPIVLHPRIS